MLDYKALIEMTGLAQDHMVGQFWMVSNVLSLREPRGALAREPGVNSRRLGHVRLFRVLGVLGLTQ